MAFPEQRLIDFHLMEDLSRGSSSIHKLDPRTKVLTTALFLILALSLGRYEVSALLPFFLYPLVLLRLSDIPVGKLLRLTLPALPLLVFIGIFNPLFDRVPLLKIGSLTVSGGWVSFLSILLRGYLTALMALTLISTTGFPQICHALRQMGVPAVFTTQLLFLYRSLFTLTEEASRMMRAWKQRNFNHKKMGLKTWGNLIGHLLLRSFDRSGRIHQALLARGFDGELKPALQTQWSNADSLYLACWTALFLFLRFCSPVLRLGEYLETLLT